MSKEFVWTLEVEGEEVIWKCVVHEDECVTYEGDVECKHLKITNHESKYGVQQIDCVTKVYDEILPFKLEKDIPYIKIEGDWLASDTTMEDRLQEQIKAVKKQALYMCVGGVFFLIVILIQLLVKGNLGEWPITPVFSIFCFTAAAMQMVRLKNELEAMGRKFTWKL